MDPKRGLPPLAHPHPDPFHHWLAAGRAIPVTPYPFPHLRRLHTLPGGDIAFPTTTRQTAKEGPFPAFAAATTSPVPLTLPSIPPPPLLSATTSPVPLILPSTPPPPPLS